MKNKISILDIILISLWGVLFFNASSIDTEGLLFGWPIQVHLTITSALIGGRMIYRRFFARVNG